LQQLERYNVAISTGEGAGLGCLGTEKFQLNKIKRENR